MDMNWLEGILYGLLSGIAEFVPVSAQAHKAILRQLLGANGKLPLMELFIHMGVLAALIVCINEQIHRLYREYQLRRNSRRRRRAPDRQSSADISLLKTACVPLILGFVFYAATSRMTEKLYIVAIFLLLNGILLYIPLHVPTGNKDARTMSKLDSLFIGILSMASVLPGISRIGMCCSASVLRGAEPKQAYRWGLFLSIPALAIMCCFDIYDVFVAGFGGMGMTVFLQCVLSGIMAYIGAFFTIKLVRSLALRVGLFNLSYYCWGAALFAFILYLI